MRLSILFALITGLVLSLAPAIKADPFDPKRVAGDAKYLLHIDMDLLQKANVWPIIDGQLQISQNFQDALTGIETVSGLQFPQGLHDVTIYGKAAGDEEAVSVFNADVDHDKVIGFLQGQPNYSNTTYGDHVIMGWEDKGKQNDVAFSAKGLLVIAHSEKNVENALDILDGKSDAMPADSTMAAGAKTGALVYVATTKPSELKDDKNPVLEQVNVGWVLVTEEDTNLIVHSNLVTGSEKSAHQVRSTLEGLKAFVTLAGMSKNPEAKVKLAAAALADTSAKVDDKTVIVDGTVSEDLVKKVLELRRAAEAEPADAPAK